MSGRKRKRESRGEDRGAFHVKRWMFAALGRAKRGGAVPRETSLVGASGVIWGGSAFHVERFGQGRDKSGRGRV